MDEERLIVALEARIRDFEKNMQKASRTGAQSFDAIERRAKQSGDRLESLMASASSRVASGFKNFGLGFVGGLTAGGIEGLVRGFGDMAKGIASIGDEAKRAGLSIKAFQELKYVAEQNRIGVDALTDGMKELSLRADEFIQTGGGSAAESFKRLGFTAGDLAVKLKDPSALFTEIIGKLEKLDRAAQIRIMDELFGGTGGEQFVQLIEQGEKGIRKLIQAAHDTGAVMDDELIAKADELDRKFNAITTTVGTGLKTAIVEAASALQTFITQFEGFYQRYAQRRDAGELGDFAGSLAGRTDLPSDDQGRVTSAQKGDRVRAGGIVRTDPVYIGGSTLDPSQQAQERARMMPGEIERRKDTLREFYKADSTAGSSARAGEQAGESMAVAFIKRFEGFRPDAYWDVNAFRAGYGSDTTTRANGSVERVTASTFVSLADANRDLARRIIDFQSGIRGRIGADTFNSFSEEQQAALTSIAYNYGSLPDRIVAAIRAGSPEGVGSAIRDLGDDNGGVNRKRRAQEADLFFSGSGSGATPAVTAATVALDRQEKAAAALEQRYQSLGQIGSTALQGIASALQDGEISAQEMLGIVSQLIQQLLQMPAMQDGTLFGGAGAAGSAADPWAGMRTAGGFGFFGKLLGSLFGFADGGHVRGPGGPRDDAILAKLSDGEFVVNAGATKRHRRLLEAINGNGLPGFAEGGLIRPTSLPAPPALASPRASMAERTDSERPISVTVSAPITVNGSAGTPEQNEDLARRMGAQLEGTIRSVAASEIARQLRPGNVLNRGR